MKIPTPITAAAASAHVRQPEGITDAGYLDRLAETGGHDWPAGRDGKGARRAGGNLSDGPPRIGACLMSGHLRCTLTAFWRKGRGILAIMSACRVDRVPSRAARWPDRWRPAGWHA